MTARQGERRSVSRAVCAAALGVLVGASALVGGHDVSATASRERSANSLLGPVPGDGFGTPAPAGAARGSHLPGLGASGPVAPSSPPVSPSTPPSGTGEAAGGATAPASSSKVLYLTFDDGPDPTWTPQVLALLRQYDVHATFFELGVQVEQHPALPALVRADGHRIGNHTYSHKSLPTLDASQLRRQIADGPPATCLRPPFGAVNARVRTAAARAGQTIVLWNVDSRDWSRPGTSTIVHNVLPHVHPGATILMHDAGGDRSETIAALRILLPKLIADGYTFATVPGC